jgi:hypothetical protein
MMMCGTSVSVKPTSVMSTPEGARSLNVGITCQSASASL